MTIMPQPDPNGIDEGVDSEIRACLNLETPTSFFLYAGAGSGKTRSLVNALKWLRETYGTALWLRGQRVGVITYTNAACDEIKERMDFDVLTEVSTIHSFAWGLIGSYQEDIREWLRKSLKEEITELEAAQASGRANSKAAIERAESIKSKSERLCEIETVKRFQYSPTQENRGRDSLSHSEVIRMTVAFLLEKPTLQNILVRRYPVLLIDESQDTNRHLMDALLVVQQKHQHVFCLGLFGDMMQRIYADGKVGLESAIPPTWAKPIKKMNHRCPGRVLELLNQMRTETDHQRQQGRTDNPEGIVRLFLLSENTQDKSRTEARIAKRMATITGDDQWINNYKGLILEHHMAAKRLGFAPFFEELYRIDHFRQGLLEGSLPSVSFFTKQVLPVVEAMTRGDRFAATTIVKKYSPLLDGSALKEHKEQLKRIKEAKAAVEDLMALWNKGQIPTFGQVLDSIHRTGLFELPEILRVLTVSRAAETAVMTEGVRDDAIVAWEHVLGTSFSQAAMYDRYISEDSPFDTHQGVKGREFPRVMVVIDDNDSRGFMFSYEKLFGVREKTPTDLKNERERLETSIDRTRRLLYVTCSRAQSSLAIVDYTADPAGAKAYALSSNLFRDNEILELDEI